MSMFKNKILHFMVGFICLGLHSNSIVFMTEDKMTRFCFCSYYETDFAKSGKLKSVYNLYNLDSENLRTKHGAGCNCILNSYVFIFFTK